MVNDVQFSSVQFRSVFKVCFMKNLRVFRNVGASEVKKYFTDHRTANTVQLFVAIKGNFSDLFSFQTSCSKGQFA